MTVTLADVQAAARRLEGHVRRTPVMTSGAIDAMAGRSLYFKCEHLQHVGAFKFRGATNAILHLSQDDAARGVVTHSSGNHAAAVAMAAAQRGISAWIVMPSTAATIKRDAAVGHGATIVECEPTLEARERTAADLVASTGGVLVHPYDDPRVIAGQGTATLELLEEIPDLDLIVTPVGGGGLISGACVASPPSIMIVGAEPAGADDAARSLRSGMLVPQEAPETICDGLLTSLGEHTWPIIRDRVKAIVTQDDAATITAQQLIVDCMEQRVEVNAAIALAAVLDCGCPDGDRVGIVLSGGNIQH